MLRCVQFLPRKYHSETKQHCYYFYIGNTSGIYRAHFNSNVIDYLFPAENVRSRNTNVFFLKCPPYIKFVLIFNEFSNNTTVPEFYNSFQQINLMDNQTKIIVYIRTTFPTIVVTTYEFHSALLYNYTVENVFLWSQNFSHTIYRQKI